MPGFSGTALITGASAGIGAACARAFAAAGGRLILAARRRERLEELAAELRAAHGSEVHLIPMDVRNAGAVAHALTDLPPEWSEVDVLVNNAGMARGIDRIQEGDIADWEAMIDTNVKGLLYVTRAVVPGMVERGHGHIINIGSTSAHEVYPGGAVYCATKHAVRALTQGLRLDLFGTAIRVSEVDPGLVETEFSVVRFGGDTARAAGVYEGFRPLTAEDVADAVLYVATRPPHVNVDEVILKPQAQATSTMVNRGR